MAARRRSPLTNRSRAESGAPGPLVYTAQDVARFCEVDLKTIHHWADAGKIAHHRTTGRHLRFRRNHVLAFLRRHGYPLPAEVASARPSVFVAVGPAADEAARKLAGRFFVSRFGTAIEAIAHLVASEPDALVLSAADPTWGGARAIEALRGSGGTSWPALVVVSDGGDATELSGAGADVVLAIADVARLNAELGRVLGID